MTQYIYSLLSKERNLVKSLIVLQNIYKNIYFLGEILYKSSCTKEKQRLLIPTVLIWGKTAFKDGGGNALTRTEYHEHDLYRNTVLVILSACKPTD